jgi:hypothetical protein
MAELTKKDRELAYKAGYALPGIDFDQLEAVPEDKRFPGVHHCPFDDDDPQADEWKKGLADALEKRASYDPAELAAEIRKGLE